MSDGTFALLAIALALAGWTGWGLVRAFRARTILGGVRLVTCPETGKPAAVRFDRVHAAITSFVDDKADLQLADCSRWRARSPCDQACLPQAEKPDTAVVNMIARWSASRRCVFCGNHLVDAATLGHHIALRAPDGTTTEWPDVDPEHLPDALRMHQPVCWNCHVAETFRREYPELVTDR